MHIGIVRSAILLLGLTGFAPAGWAAATYSTTADSSFTISRADDVAVNSHSGSKLEAGTGSASFGGANSPGGVLPATISVGVSGSASAPPNSFATSTFMSGHVIRIDNTGPSTGRISVPFSFTYSWATTISAGDPLTEFAFSGAFFALSGFEAGIDAIDIDGDGLGALIDPPGSSAWLLNPNYATALGETGGSGSGLITGLIIIEANTFGEFSVITDTSGLAGAIAVPEPVSLSLFGIGLAGAATLRRRKTTKA